MKKSTTKKAAKPAQAARAAKNKKTSSSKKLTTTTLRMLNLIVSFLLAAQAVALVLLSNKDKGEVSVTANYLTRDPAASGVSGQTVLSPAVDQLASVNPAYLIAAFLIFASLAALLNATRLRPRYDSELKTGVSRLRWIGYVFSAGTLFVTAALLVGLSDIAALLMIFTLTAVACTAALRAEEQRLLKKSLSRLALLALLVPLVIIAMYVFFSHVYGGGLPLEYLLAVGILGLGILISVLGLSNVYRANPKPNQYLAVERAYLIFSFLVSSAFAWTVFSLLLK